ncbi:MAG: 2-amino-4-hydroxy-6-hydroxymethyldihydropteridine diphosphokinase, partial [Nitrospirae bacterium]|nr:2-amino-4-hydroxy-6-hydroxymethyldihydropteridine diphosphokinase [Nitrospirota bacterium]
DTELPPRDLAAVLRRIESALGKAVAFPNGPRTIDMDLLMFDDQRISSPDLVVPHPRFRDRRFVLVPLAEAAPEAVDPVSGETIAGLLSRCPDRSAVEAA